MTAIHAENIPGHELRLEGSEAAGLWGCALSGCRRQIRSCLARARQPRSRRFCCWEKASTLISSCSPVSFPCELGEVNTNFVSNNKQEFPFSSYMMYFYIKIIGITWYFDFNNLINSFLKL